GRIDWARAATLEFQPVDRATFPLLDLAVRAGREGATAPAALNAANEEAVAAFLEKGLPFPAIAEVVAEVLERHQPPAVLDLDAVLATERWSRDLARTLVEDLITSRGN
ncbi:MAG TPA: 1-deoxy-D-xylulose-5-phosphate reductoisomerase, partial [Actinomycetota bacterium]|nr:1-deoxy-D-xylulose-5-phosphate reductoisomerase [Actinomycetota bacterium]